jgi:hypothetical protein
MSIIPQIKLFVDKGKKKLSDWIKLEMNEFGQIREDLGKRVFQPLRETEEKIGKYEVPFLPKTSALRYLPGEMAKTAGEYLLPQTPLEAGLFAIPFGTLAKPLKPLAKTPIGKKVVRVATKELGEIAPKLFTGLKNISTKLLEKFRSMPTEITEQQFREVLNRAEKEGIRKADKDLIVGLAEKQIVKSDKAVDLINKEVDKEIFVLSKRGYKPTGEKVGWTLDNGIEHIEINLKNAKGNEINLYARSNGSKVLTKLDTEPLSKTMKPGFGEDIFKGTEFSYGAKMPTAKLNLTKLASDVEEQLVPLTATSVKSPRWSNIGEDFIGDGKYGEIVYQSPVKTSAGEVHFHQQKTGYRRSIDNRFIYVNKDSFPNYFSHIRYEDMADGKTRKILETQSDLFQKGRLEMEKDILEKAPKKSLKPGDEWFDKQIEIRKEKLEGITKLQPYSSNDPLAHLRTFREEVKRAAKDGKDTLLIPSGETAMKIEGLGEAGRYQFRGVPTPENPMTPIIGERNLKIGREIERFYGMEREGERWIITDILGEGKFKAMPKEHFDSFAESKGVQNLSGEDLMSYAEQHATKNFWGSKETFDISGKVDAQHFVYKLNEEAIPREARKMGLEVEGKIDLAGTLDSKNPFKASRYGTWWKIKIPPERAGMPVEAYGAGLIPFLSTLQPKQEGYDESKKSNIPFINKLNQQLFINK